MRSLRFKVLLAGCVAASAACGGTASDPIAPGGDTTGGLAGAAGVGGTSGGGASGSAGLGLAGANASGGTASGGVGGTSGNSASGGVGGTSGNSASGGVGGQGAAGGASSGAAGSLAGLGGFGGAGGGSAGSAGSAGSSGAGGDGGTAGSGNQRPARVLLYHFSTLDIPSLPEQLDILQSKLESWSYEVERSEDPAVFSDETLEQFAAVGMINTCFFPFGANNTTGEPQAQALQRFLQDGGGLFGTHCADVTFQAAATPVLYNQLLGGRASSEYFEGVSECSALGEHPTIAELPSTFAYTGNLDNTNFLASDIEVLVRCRWGNAQNTDVAVSWVRTEGSGRVFFTSFGKVAADLTNATIGDDHILAGLAWVLSRS